MKKNEHASQIEFPMKVADNVDAGDSFSITWAWKSGKDSNLLTSVSVPLSCLFSVAHASFPVLFSASLASSSFLPCHFHTAIILFQVNDRPN